MINRENLVADFRSPAVMQPYCGQVFDIAAYFDGLRKWRSLLNTFNQFALDWNLVLTQLPVCIPASVALTYPVILSQWALC